MPTFPIDSILPKLKEAVRNNPAVVLQAPPGAGKTTRVPLALLDILPSGKKIVMLEPRRIAATSASRWMAKSLNEEVGETIGYAIRFDRKVSPRTRIEVVTEGILTRRIQSDPALSDMHIVIFDEFHERSIHADLALALCIDVQKGLRPDLKLLVMSATLEASPVAELLGNAPIVTSEGKAYPVEERYSAKTDEPLPRRIASAVRTALREANGDILVFLPGAGEIRAASREIEGSIDLVDGRLSLHPLYGDLPFEDQERAILTSKDRRRIVLATNIAETSLTIEGVSVVIDCGLTRTLRHDPSLGMNRLVTIPVSAASAEQRKGRAGRLGPGACYRLYTKEEFRALVPFNKPEIAQSDLAELALELAVWGVKDPKALSWLDPPPAESWNAAIALLRGLEALDATDSTTATGREMAKLPLHPRLAKLMFKANELGCLELGANLAALLSERDIFRSNATEGPPEPDIADRVEILHRWRKTKETGGIADPHALRSVDRASGRLVRMLRASAERKRLDAQLVPRFLLSAFPDRVCKQREKGGQGYVIMEGRGVRLPKTSHLLNNPYLVAAHVDAGEKKEGSIRLAAPLTEELIRRELGSWIRKSRSILWDAAQSRVIASEDERLGELTLSLRAFNPSDEEALPVLFTAIRSAPALLEFDKPARQLQARVKIVQTAFPNETWPDLSDERLLRRPEEWLADRLSRARSGVDLRKIDVQKALKEMLTHKEQRLLDERAPVAIQVPSGSRITLDYAAGNVPVLAVKLQELFGLGDTPTVCEGRVKVLLHLLSPAGRPVQVTQDLRNFWNTVYPEVKKALKGRYPRHPWPDDPWNAAPTRRAKPKK